MINNELLSQFAARGLTINEGIAVDTRLIQSASHPISKEKLEEEKRKRDTPASFHDSPYLPLCVAGSCHTKDPIKKVYADKGYFFMLFGPGSRG